MSITDSNSVAIDDSILLHAICRTPTMRLSSRNPGDQKYVQKATNGIRTVRSTESIGYI